MTTFKEFLQLNELIGVKKFHGKTKSDVLRHVKKEGKYKLIGSGAHAHAFEYKGVIYKFWSLDSGYDAFVKYAAANQDNPFLPKFLSKAKTLPASFLNKHMDHPDTVKWIKMEKLTPGMGKVKVTTSGHPITLHFAISVARHVMKQKVPAASVKELLKRSLVWWAMSNAEPDKYDPSDMNSQPMPGKLSEQGEALADVLFGLSQAAEANGLDLDDHKEDNFMMRGNQPVFIDPFFTYESVEKNRDLLFHDFDVEDAEDDENSETSYEWRKGEVNNMWYELSKLIGL